jgi:hypothetical protein
VLIVAKTLQPVSVPSAIEKIAATVVPSVVISPSPAAASPSDSKLNAPGTNAQNAAGIITIAGGDVLIRAPSIANGTTRNARPPRPSASATSGVVPSGVYVLSGHASNRKATEGHTAERQTVYHPTEVQSSRTKALYPR